MNQSVKNLKVFEKIYFTDQVFLDQSNCNQINNISAFERNLNDGTTTLLNDDLVVNQNIQVTNTLKSDKVRLNSLLYQEDVDEDGNIREQKRAFTEDMRAKIDLLQGVIPDIVDPTNKKIKLISSYTGLDPILYPPPDSSYNGVELKDGRFKIIDNTNNLLLQIHQPLAATYIQNLYYNGTSGGSLNFVLKNAAGNNYFPIQCIAAGGVVFNDNVSIPTGFSFTLATGATANLKNTNIVGNLVQTVGSTSLNSLLVSGSSTISGASTAASYNTTGSITQTGTGVFIQTGTGANSLKDTTFTNITVSGGTNTTGTSTAGSYTTTGNFNQGSTGIISQTGTGINSLKDTTITNLTTTGSSTAGSFNSSGNLNQSGTGIISQSGTGTNSLKDSTLSNATINTLLTLAANANLTFTSPTNASSGIIIQTPVANPGTAWSNRNKFIRSFVTYNSGSNSNSGTSAFEIYDECTGTYNSRGLIFLPNNITGGLNPICTIGDSTISTKLQDTGAITIAPWSTLSSGIRLVGSTSTPSVTTTAGTTSLTVSSSGITVTKPITLTLSSTPSALNQIGGTISGVFTNATGVISVDNSNVRNFSNYQFPSNASVPNINGIYLISWAFEATANSSNATMTRFEIGISSSASNTFDDYQSHSTTNLNIVPLCNLLSTVPSPYYRQAVQGVFSISANQYIYFNYRAAFTGASTITLGGTYTITRLG